jgi:hypothetical protein
MLLCGDGLARDGSRAALERGLDGGPREGIILRGHHEDRPAKRRAPNDLVRANKLGQILACEGLKTREERDERRLRPLRLDGEQAADGVERGDLLRREEHLTREGRARQCSEREQRLVFRGSRLLRRRRLRRLLRCDALGHRRRP